MAGAARKTAPKKVAPVKTEEKKVPKGYIVAEGGPYVAKKACTYGISMFKPLADGGKVLKTQKGDIIPYHFMKKKDYKKMLEEQEDGVDEDEE